MPIRNAPVWHAMPDVYKRQVYKIEDETVQEVDEQGIQQFLEAF